MELEICYANESIFPNSDVFTIISFISNTEIIATAEGNVLELLKIIEYEQILVLIISVFNALIAVVLLVLFGVFYVKVRFKKSSCSEFESRKNQSNSEPKEDEKGETKRENVWKKRREFISKSCVQFSNTPPKDVDQLDLEHMKKILYNESRESQESGREYEPGGYMPITPGDILNGTYRVIRKLGYGHFSTVWLCKSLLNSGPRFVAIKICKSDQMFAAVAQDEIRLLEDTRRIDPDHPGYKNIVQMVATFNVDSINGTHIAIALEIMGPSLLHLLIQSEFRGIQVSGIRRIIQQVLLGLTYLHEKCRIIHTDIKPENILIKVKETYIEEMAEKAERFSQFGLKMPRSYVAAGQWREIDEEEDTTEDLCAKFEEKRAQSYPYDVFLADLCNFRERHKEPSFTEPIWINSNIEIKIADLGNACWEDRHFATEIQTRQYRALEVIMGAGYSYPADIWSVGCLAFEMATGEMLFSPKGHSQLDVNVDHLSLIWETLGGIPAYITETGTEAKVYFKNGRLIHVPSSELRVWKIEDVLVEKYKWKRVDAIPFAGFIESLIEPDPELRITASLALHHDWLNES